MTMKFAALLEIDPGRGVIYVHSVDTGTTLLRIGGLPTPIPDPRDRPLDMVFGRLSQHEHGDAPFPVVLNWEEQS